MLLLLLLLFHCNLKPKVLSCDHETENSVTSTDGSLDKLEELQVSGQMEFREEKTPLLAAATESPGSAASFKLFVVGKSGTGKSSLGNQILGRDDWDCFPVEHGLTTTTTQLKEVKGHRFGVALTVVDTPDCSSDLSVVNHINWGSVQPLHVLLFPVRCDDRFSADHYSIYRALKARLGPQLQSRLIVIFTHGDKRTSSFSDRSSREFNAHQTGQKRSSPPANHTTRQESSRNRIQADILSRQRNDGACLTERGNELELVESQERDADAPCKGQYMPEKDDIVVQVEDCPGEGYRHQESSAARQEPREVEQSKGWGDCPGEGYRHQETSAARQEPGDGEQDEGLEDSGGSWASLDDSLEKSLGAELRETWADLRSILDDVHDCFLLFNNKPGNTDTRGVFRLVRTLQQMPVLPPVSPSHHLHLKTEGAAGEVMRSGRVAGSWSLSHLTRFQKLLLAVVVILMAASAAYIIYSVSKGNVADSLVDTMSASFQNGTH